jgi:hypothetical protein
MLASAQPVLHRAVAPIFAASGFTSEGYRISRKCVAGSVSLARAVSINDAKSDVVEADHSK